MIIDILPLHKLIYMQGQKKGSDKVSPRTGRPPKQGSSRNKDINIRLTEKELKDIEECAEILSMSRTDTIMKGIELLKAQIKK